MFNGTNGATPAASRTAEPPKRSWTQGLGGGVSRSHDDSGRLAALVGGAAVVFSAVYAASDLIELAQGGFSTLQLALTYAAEAAIPLFVLGLFALQRPRIGSLGLVGAVVYAYTFVFFTGTVVYALVNHIDAWDGLTRQLGAWVTVHSVLMVFAGVIFGIAVVRAGVLPRWTGLTLVLGMVLMASTLGLPDVIQTMSAGVRDVAFAGMGLALLRHPLPPKVGERAARPSEAQRSSAGPNVATAPGDDPGHERWCATPATTGRRA